MEVKKSVKADLQNKKGLFLEIGLLVSVGLVILLFAMKQSEKVLDKREVDIPIVEEELVEITKQEEPQTAPVPRATSLVSDIINIVREDVKINENTNIFNIDAELSSTGGEWGGTFGNQGSEGIEDDTPFLRAEVMPSFMGGGIEKFKEWVYKQLNYPDDCLQNNIQGTVQAIFVIERDGTLSTIEIASSPHSSLSKEVTRVLKLSPKWGPATQGGKTVRLKYSLPITFKI